MMVPVRKIIEAAFRPPARVSAAFDSSRFVFLPQQSEDELFLSEAHTELDHVMGFLQDIGYSLLADAQPKGDFGGGVNIQRPKGCGHHSNRVPSAPRMPREEPASGFDDVSPKSASGPNEKDTTIVEDDSEREIIRFSATTAKYAYYPDDLILIWRFSRLVGINTPSAESKAQSEAFTKTVLQGVRLMHLCRYSYSDVVMTLVHASVYIKGVLDAIGDNNGMSEDETANICVLLIYLAHSFLIDEACPLKCWQQRIFKKYCSLKVLDAALFRLFRTREFGLRISPDAEKSALNALLSSNSNCDIVLHIGDQKQRGGEHLRKDADASLTSHTGETASSRDRKAGESGRHRQAGG